MLKNGEKLIKKNIVVYIIATISCLMWGSAFPFIKIGYKLLGITSSGTSSQILFAGVRFMLTGVLTILIFSAVNRHFLLPHKKSLANIGKLSVVQTVMQYIFFYIGLSNTTASKSSIIGGAAPFITILIACFIYRQERFTRAKLIGSLLGFAGIIVINLDFLNGKTSMSLFGDGFIFMSNITSAWSSSMVKNYSADENPVTLNGYQFLFGGVVLTAIGLIMGGTLNIENINAVLVLAYLALLSAVAGSLWNILLKYHPVSKVSVFSFMIPLFGVVLSAILLNEMDQAFNLQSLASLLMVCLGIIIINKFQTRKVSKASDCV